MKKVLLTGFTRFGEYKINPSGEIVKRLNGKTIKGNKIIGLILPVVFGKAGQMVINAIKKHQPDIVISLGLSNNASGIIIERVGLNIHTGKDESCVTPSSEYIIKDGAPAYFSGLPSERILAKLRKNNIPANISYHAGTYLCNEVLYTALNYIAAQKLSIKAGFIHIPNLPEQIAKHPNPSRPSMSLEMIAKAVKIVVESLRSGD
jgi:pyroglutamyl-peptidase